MDRLRDIGEKKMVSTITSMLNTSAMLGPGDDAAVLKMGDRCLVISTDMLWQGTHFHLSMSWWQKGWMAAAVNFSDVAAMGAQPLGLLLAMGLPSDLHIKNVQDIVQGAADCCDRLGTDYLGGDTKECSELVLTGTALGNVPRGGLLTRSGARPGDILVMTGSAGLASAGLLALDRGLNAEKAIRALFEPIPRVKEGALLSSSGMVTSCMDTSDGLSTSMHELADASGVGFEVDYDSIPVDPETRWVAEECGTELDSVILHGGGDYQLLFTIRPEGWNAVQKLMGTEATVIGHCLEGNVNNLKRGTSYYVLEPGGYEHFRR